jgi:ABC-2 type transport system ATP-binding protein
VRRERVARHAVRDVSFKVGEGEIVGLVGANGAGKTTLVKMLSGVIVPTSGEARVLGYRPWERDDRLRRQIALIMGQKAQLWWDLPAADCFLLLREIYEIPERSFEERLAYLTYVLGVRDELNVQIRRLSLGERMKMELVAALLHAPRVVYLDEPTIGLDLTAQRAIRDFVLSYREEHQPAMILTSHYMEDIERLCERILIVREGELVYDGSLRRVVERFANHKVLTARLEEGRTLGSAREAIERLGAILEIDDVGVRVQVPRGEVATAASALLAMLPVADLSIEEEDVGSIIEKVMRAKREVHS